MRRPNESHPEVSSRNESDNPERLTEPRQIPVMESTKQVADVRAAMPTGSSRCYNSGCSSVALLKSVTGRAHTEAQMLVAPMVVATCPAAGYALV